MSRYASRPRALEGWYDEDLPLLPHLEVSGPHDVDTGLVDVKGEPIYRLAIPIGFGRDTEW